jgi:hypothetical protein
MAKTKKMPQPQKSSAKAKAAVNKTKGAATNATPPSKESFKMKAKKKTTVGKDSEAEQHNPSRSAKSKADKKSGDEDIDRTGIESIMNTSAVVAALSGPSNRKAAAAATAPKKTKLKKPAPQTDVHTFWKRFTELCQYMADDGTMSPPPKDSTDNILANWVHYTRKRYTKKLLPAKVCEELEWNRI